ncbi:hypothetical protein T11_3262 [Trichinella zimbabwensis]|uniref:Uncharacterized protein n=1 Tax=Trichinella zimbabwensis TaxID=268475 RepID=A0A0V1GI70_9BILA|nr:hypothetical protein T11_3262 [Trichinella zimbabwensis]
MSMTFYGKLWSLLCCHLPDQVSMKASPNGRRVVIGTKSSPADTSLNPVSYAVGA